MKIEVIEKKLSTVKTPVLIIPIYKDEKMLGQLSEINTKLGGFIESIIKDGYYTPDLGQVHVVYTYDKIKTKKIVLVGLGAKIDLTDEKLLKAYSAAIAYVGKTKTTHCAIFIGKQSQEALQNIIETSLLALYKFNHHKSKKENHSLTNLEFIIEGKQNIKSINEIIAWSQLVADAIYEARDLANHPSNVITPAKFAKEAKELGKGTAIKTTIFDEKQMAKLGLGLMLSVSRGSDEEAHLIVMDYKPKKYKKTIALIGKGLTFDSGGISIKPSENMHEMKMDMSGAAAVLATFKAIKKLKPNNVRIIGAIGATENLPGHQAQKPGDIWKSYNGKTVEVLNTDAEGRLVLADVIGYVQKNYKPEYMIDLATLTGACVVALGHEYAGLFTNSDKLKNMLLEISGKNYEKLWPMPINEAYHEEMKSDIADLRNIGNGREGGASTGAAFLEEFVDPKIAWAHIDIAGTAMLSRPIRAYEYKGGTGAGVKTLLEFVKMISR